MDMAALWMAVQTRATLPHHRVGRHLDGQARLKHSYTSQVGGIGALLGLAEDDLVYRLRLQLRLLQRFEDDDLAQILGLDVLEPSAQPAYRRSHGTDDHNFFHETFSSRLLRRYGCCLFFRCFRF